MTNGKILLLGTNLGDLRHNLVRCREMIRSRVGEIVQTSGIYETAAWGKTNQPAFLNQVLMVETDLPPQQLLSTLNTIEAEMGRVRKEKWGERLIDIDILYYDDELVDTIDLKIPHPEIARRRFTLEPLNELVPDLIDPLHRRSIQDLLAACSDGSMVIKKTDT